MNMFEKKEIIFSETLGVCMVHDITKLTGDHANTLTYYVLKNVYNKEKVAYIPVENHKVHLRPLMDVEAAQELYKKAVEEDSLKDMEETMLQELAYVLSMKLEDLLPQDGE